MSREYILQLVLVVGVIAKFFGFEFDNGTIEAVLVGIIGIVTAVLRYQKGDITIGGFKK